MKIRGVQGRDRQAGTEVQAVRRRPGWLGRAALLSALLASGVVAARPVAIGGLRQSAGLDSRQFVSGEALAVWTLPRLGVAVRNDPQDLRLRLGARELQFSPGSGWRATGFTLGARLPAPELAGGSLFVPLSALLALGVPVLADTPDLLDFAAPARVPSVTLPPSLAPSSAAPVAAAGTAAATPTGAAQAATVPGVAGQSALPTPTFVPTANLNTVRVSRSMHRSVEVQRVVLEFNVPDPRVIAYSVTREANGLRVTLPGVSGSPVQQTLESGDALKLELTGTGSALFLGTGGGRSEIFTLESPARVVIDTTTYTDTSVPPPVNPDTLPAGVTYQQQGKLHLLSFDPALYQTRVVSAPAGRASGVADLVRSAGGVAGVNGGYFDPATHLPVDLVATNGLMTAGSLEKRATLGITAQGDTLFGYPRPRYVLSGADALGTPYSVTVNSVRARPAPDLLTAFVGDGRSGVGADNLTTLYVTPGAGRVLRAFTGPVVPPAGTLAVTFDPTRFPHLPRAAGAPLNVALDWRATDAPWAGAVDALSAGPLLVQGGKVVLDPAREGFNTNASIWRPTRQVAFGMLGGRPTIAFLEYGSPETFAAALAGAGVRDAVRLDSGSSATAYVTGGYADLGGYLNTVWSRAVPNALVLVPRPGTAASKH
ncbi:phosphodiester glycosidase family protein [Deinococcus sp.]|uniref:phosphodiester glycosidase family protein n=1 Tax=Deinococcus sp. TaxID=47478 RepID=UPI0025C3FEEB|nr:phosphodiester glycosidase family protein [Deinococcus sp.]